MDITNDVMLEYGQRFTPLTCAIWRTAPSWCEKPADESIVSWMASPAPLRPKCWSSAGRSKALRRRGIMGGDTAGLRGYPNVGVLCPPILGTATASNSRAWACARKALRFEKGRTP